MHAGCQRRVDGNHVSNPQLGRDPRQGYSTSNAQIRSITARMAEASAL